MRPIDIITLRLLNKWALHSSKLLGETANFNNFLYLLRLQLCKLMFLVYKTCLHYLLHCSHYLDKYLTVSSLHWWCHSVGDITSSFLSLTWCVLDESHLYTEEATIGHQWSYEWSAGGAVQSCGDTGAGVSDRATHPAATRDHSLPDRSCNGLSSLHSTTRKCGLRRSSQIFWMNDQVISDILGQ